jgi:hypothetical protein
VTSSLGKGIALGDLAQKILECVVDHYEAAGVELPPRQCVVPGNPAEVAWDCQQLAVGLAGVGWGQIADQAPLSPKPGAHASVGSMRHAVFSIQLVRCTPVGGRDGASPPAEEIHASGMEFMRDAGLLSQALVTMTSQLRRDFALDRSGLVQPGVIAVLGPAGGLHAVEATIAVTSGELA